MFKKGQLVKTAYGFGVVGKESTVYLGAYIVRSLAGDCLSTVCYYWANELKLIGNNFKFKGAK